MANFVVANYFAGWVFRGLTGADYAFLVGLGLGIPVLVGILGTIKPQGSALVTLVLVAVTCAATYVLLYDLPNYNLPRNAQFTPLAVAAYASIIGCSVGLLEVAFVVSALPALPGPWGPPGHPVTLAGGYVAGFVAGGLMLLAGVHGWLEPYLANAYVLPGAVAFHFFLAGGAGGVGNAATTTPLGREPLHRRAVPGWAQWGCHGLLWGLLAAIVLSIPGLGLTDAGYYVTSLAFWLGTGPGVAVGALPPAVNWLTRNDSKDPGAHIPSLRATAVGGATAGGVVVSDLFIPGAHGTPGMLFGAGAAFGFVVFTYWRLCAGQVNSGSSRSARGGVLGSVIWFGVAGISGFFLRGIPIRGENFGEVPLYAAAAFGLVTLVAGISAGLAWRRARENRREGGQ